jgi:hypothetical protein
VATVRIENRSQLTYLLTEAAELEHGILCCYLFAMFSMKNDTSEGITQEQLDAIRRWRASIREVALQEMVHLGSACNLLTAVGGAPQLRRLNLPTPPKAYGFNLRLQLAPFGVESLEQFIEIEKPEALREVEESAGSVPPAIGNLSDIFSSERRFDTIGALYRGIEDGLKYLSHKLGEAGLFIGFPGVQTANTYFNMTGLIPVKDLASALEAIQIIVEQGEGASIDVQDSHYARFQQVYQDYVRMRQKDPGFDASRPVLHNPYVTQPPGISEHDVSIIGHPLSIDVSNLFDGCYELMIQMLGRLFVHAEETEAELQAMANIGARMMVEVLEPLGSALTLLPAGSEHPGKNAGPSFRLTRGATIPTKSTAARTIFNERLGELANYCRFLEMEKGSPASLPAVREALQGYAAQFA